MTYLFFENLTHCQSFGMLHVSVMEGDKLSITLVSSFRPSFQREIPRYLPKFGPDILVLEIYFLLYLMQICEGAQTRISDIVFTLSRALAPEIFCYYSSGSGCCSHTALFISGIQQVICTLGSLCYSVPLAIMRLRLTFSCFSGLTLSITSSQKLFPTFQHKVDSTSSHSSLLNCDPHSCYCLLFPFLFMSYFSEICKRSIFSN